MKRMIDFACVNKTCISFDVTVELYIDKETNTIPCKVCNEDMHKLLNLPKVPVHV